MGDRTRSGGFAAVAFSLLPIPTSPRAATRHVSRLSDNCFMLLAFLIISCAPAAIAPEYEQFQGPSAAMGSHNGRLLPMNLDRPQLLALLVASPEILSRRREDWIEVNSTARDLNGVESATAYSQSAAGACVNASSLALANRARGHLVSRSIDRSRLNVRRNDELGLSSANRLAECVGAAWLVMMMLCLVYGTGRAW